MRHSTPIALLVLVAACSGAPTPPLADAISLGDASTSLLIAVRGRGEVTHAADQSGATVCSTVLPNPEKLDCTRTFALGTVVTLQPAAAPGFVLDHWGGACAGKSTCSVTMNERRVVEAIFKAVVVAPTSQTLTLAVRGRGQVTHTADLTGASSCSTLEPSAENADCTRTFAHNAVVTLQATAAPGRVFDHWGGPCTGTGTCTITMNERRALEAIFKVAVVPPSSYTLKLLVRGQGAVQHTADLTGATSCAPLPATPDVAECSRTFAPGAEAVLQALPATGFTFLGWPAPCSGTGTCTLKMNENRTVEVRFRS